VGSSGRKEAFEFEQLLSDDDDESAQFYRLIEKLTRHRINIVLTLDPRVATPERSVEKKGT
jgi:hypothetical protein